MKVKFTKYTAVATWRWKQGTKDDVCGICQMAFESTCPNDACKYPGEGCPVSKYSYQERDYDNPLTRSLCSRWRMHTHISQTLSGRLAAKQDRVPNVPSR